jgi:hypothetical protein
MMRLHLQPAELGFPPPPAGDVCREATRRGDAPPPLDAATRRVILLATMCGALFWAALIVWFSG